MDRIPHNVNPGNAPRPANRRSSRVTTFLVALVVIAVLMGGRAVSFWVDWQWFGEVGYRSVFWTLFQAKWSLAIGFALLFLLIALPNIWLALRMMPPPAIPVDLRGQVELMARKTMGPILYGGAAFLALVMAATAAAQYESFLLYRSAEKFGITDPLFHNDIGYYVFRLPFQNFIVGFALSSLVLTILGIAVVYAASIVQYYDPVKGWAVAGRRIPPQVVRHISVLAALALLVKAVSYWLHRYALLYGSSSVVTAGAGYSDVHARLPVLYVLMVLSVLAALAWLVQLAFRRIHWGAVAVVVLVLVSMLGGGIYPGIVEQFQVKPTQFTAEEPYIKNNIEATRRAYGIDKTLVTEFAIKNDATPGLIRRNAETISNIRLWDYNIAAQAYRQLQEIKPYYLFNTVDVDRYMLNGMYRQVLISVREMNQDQLPDQAQTFQNQRLVYTHGFGVCVSPVNAVSSDNMPTFLVKGIPPVTTAGLKLTQPRVYFGETQQPWVVVGGASSEFDYPSTTDVYKNYEGKAGIRIGGALSRLALYSHLGGDTNFLLSKFITPDSRLLIRRQIRERITTIAPFLRLDRDAYPVLANGRIIWMQDAYTTTDRYPYSEAVGDLNYIRNSVKIAVDAYDGTVDFYQCDPQDPIVRTYAKIFPGLFKPMADMPAELRDHMRYPEDLFNVQSSKYLTYHMTDAKTFFTREDAWDVPRSARGTLGEQSDDLMEAYYVIMRLPKEQRQEMVMIRPFTPRRKNNMVAWMAARCDGPSYGQLVTYRFPIDDLPLGPSQMDASILQKPEISKDLTLLNQQGSRVILGNMLTLPLEQSLLYVQPLYLQSQSRANARAELVRVIVAYGDRVEMGSSLAEALNGVFGQGAGLSQAPSAGGQSAPAPGRMDNRTLVRRAGQAWSKAQAAQKAGDWAGYGAALKELERALQDLERANP